MRINGQYVHDLDAFMKVSETYFDDAERLNEQDRDSVSFEFANALPEDLDDDLLAVWLGC